jgi:hypothetical protein
LRKIIYEIESQKIVDELPKKQSGMEQIEIFEPGEVFLFQFTNEKGELLDTDPLLFEQWAETSNTWDVENLIS